MVLGEEVMTLNAAETTPDAGVTAAGVADAGPVHGAVGVTENVATYSSGYTHPATAVTPPAVSSVSNQPLTMLVFEPGAAVNVAGGIVITAAVSVYVGMSETGTSALLIVAGGQGYAADELAGIEDGVPVCHGANVPEKSDIVALREEHMPKAVLGSLGIHPCSRPSWYDHSGASTRPAWDGAICEISSM